MNKTRTHRWLGCFAAGLLAAALAGCGGGDPTGPQGTPGTGGSSGSTGPAGPPGATGNVNAAFITPQEWAAAQFSATVDAVSISSPPVVEFTVVDDRGRPVQGLETITSTGDGRGGTYAKVDDKQIVGYPNVSFALAKLMPRTDARPSSWVSYIVTAVPTTTSTSVTAARPSTDNTGTLEAVAGKPGSYKYTFFRDVPGTKALVDRLTLTGANDRKEDLGDLAWQPDLPHRLTIQIGGSAPGTGSNTPTGTQATLAVNMANPVNLTYDFVPASGKVLAPRELTREDVSIDNCNVCHGKLAIHGGDEALGIPNQRVEVRYCVVCHTDQRSYGRAKATSSRLAATATTPEMLSFPKLTETATKNSITGITSFTYSPNTYVADGEAAGNFTTMIHKIHQGHTLVKQNYHYAGAAFNLKGFSKLGEGQKMCTTCHVFNADTRDGNYNQIPSRQSCGACHDGIKWDTGTGSTLGDKMKVVFATDLLKSTGHLGGAYQDDGTCKSCHTTDNIKISHRTENITKNNPQITDGLASFRYEVKSATVNASNEITIEFGIWQKTSPSDVESLVTFVPPAPTVSNPLVGFTGGPSFLLPYAQTQDNITSPADYNNFGRTSAQPRSVSVATLLSTNLPATSTNPGNPNGANGSIVPSTGGYYTATMKGAYVFPVGATMRAVALQGYFSQVSGPAAPPAAANGRHAVSVIWPVTGDVERRKVVDSKKCAGCHEWIEAHGGNRVAEPQVCVACHVPGLATSGRGVSDAFLNPQPQPPKVLYQFNIAQTRILNDWNNLVAKTAEEKFVQTAVSAALKFPVTSNNFKDMIHGIHAGRDRVSPMQIARDSTSRGSIDLLDFRRMDFPGKLNNCETCHVTYTGASSGPGSVQTYGVIPAGSLVSTYESINAAYAAAILGGTATPANAKASLATPNLTDNVTTPYTAACVSCHDGSTAKAHMSINNGSLNVTRAAAQPNPRPLEDVESCAVCHGPGSTFDTAKVHK